MTQRQWPHRTTRYFNAYAAQPPVGLWKNLADFARLKHRRSEGLVMARIHYKVVQHDGGWAYKLDDVFSEPFRTREAAVAAAKRVAAEQHIPGDLTQIEYQDASGRWHTEISEADDRPDADVIE
ncbi:MAG: DUF2188 domain-containing protein [Rhodopila sp.]